LSITINAKSYTPNNVDGNIVGYIGPAHTLTTKDIFSLGRTSAKPTTVFSGVVRSDGKLTRTLTLTGAQTSTGDAILEIKTSIPVGAAAADIDTLLNDAGAFLASATYKDIVKKSQVFF